MTAEPRGAAYWTAPAMLRSARFAFTTRPPKEIQEVFGVADDSGAPTPEDPQALPPAANGPVFPVVP